MDAYTNTAVGEVVLTFAAANSSSVSQQPVGGQVGAALATQPKVTLQQAGSAASGVTVTASIDDSPARSGSQIAPVLDGTPTVTTDSSGVATFTNLSIRGPTGSYRLRFTAPGFPTATSSAFTLTIGTPSALSQITASPTSIQVANPGNTSGVTVQALDVGGNTITSGGANVTLAASTGSIGSVTNVGNGTYTATYTGTSVMGTTTITGTINSISIDDTATVTQAVGAASALSITTQPAAGASQSGVALATQPVVRVVDAFGNLVSSSTASITATLTSGTGTLSGTRTVSAVAGVATFTNLSITGTASQSYQITFDDSGPLTAAVSNSFSLAKASQTINFGAGPSPTWSSGGTFSVSATASSSLPVTYSIDASSTSVCSIADGAVGTVTMLTAGSCVVNANQAGNADFNAAPQAQQTVSIAKANQTVSFAYTGSTKAFGDAAFSVASMASATSGLAPTFTSSTTGVCTVTSAGTVTLVAQGTCTITANQAGDARYNPATAVPQSFTVNRGTTSVVWTPTTAITVPQSGLTLTQASTPGNGAISYSIDDSTTTGCAVNSSTRELTFTASGNCVVRATSAQTPQWNSASTTVTFVISRASQTIDFPAILGKVYGDAPFTVTVSAPSNNVILTTTTTAAVCTVSGTTVTILRAGTCSLTASAAQTTAYLAAPNATQSFTVSPASPTISWSPTLAITADDTRSFTPSALATSNGGPITYSVDSAGATGCTVNANTAVVTYVTAGSCAIKATSAATDDTAAGFTTRTFVITKATQSISFTAPGNQNYGNPVFLTSASTTAPGRTVTFTSLTPLVCGVTGAATPIAGATWASVSIVGVGTCSLRASQPGDDIYAAAAVQDRSFVVAQGTQAALVFTNSTSGVYDDTLTLATAGGSGTGAVTYALIGGTAICSLNATTGRLTFGTAANGTGTCVVQATKAGDTNYSSQSTANTTITVARAPQAITFTSTVPAAPLPGDTYSITATASSGSAVTLTALGGCTLSTGSAPATLSFTATGPCTVLANSAATANYDAAYEESQMMVVGALSQTITTSAIADRAYGSASFSIAGSTSASSGLTVSYSSDDTSVCTVTSGGIISTHAVGACRIRLTQAGNAQYAPASPVLSIFNVFAVAPNRPFIFSASAGDGAISVAFSSPGFTGGAPVTAYRLVATPTGSGVAVSDDSCSVSPCTLTGLVNGTEYTLTVAGINTAGVGLASLPSGALTPVTRAAAVSNLTAIPSSTSISVAWKPLTTAQLGGGTFVRYDIYHRPTGGSWPLTADDSLPGQTDDSLVITGLVNGTSYAIKVVAITTANSTELVGNTAIVFEYAATVPSPPTALIAMKWTSDTSALVSWSAPLSDGGRPVTAYAVTTSAGVGCTPSPATDDTCVITGLPLGATLTVSARATNAMGSSAAATISYTTPAAPGPTPGPGPGPGPIPPGPTPTPPTPPGPQPIPGPPPGPGEVEVIVDGKPVPGTTTTPGDGSVTVGGSDGSAGGGEFTLTLSSFMGGQRVPLGPGDVLTVPERGQVQVEGTGYALRSQVSVYIGGSPMLLLGTIMTNSSGTFRVRLSLPTAVTAGDYILQVNGYNVGANVRSINVGLTVTKAPWIKIKGQRGVERVTVEGLSGEIIEGTTIYPMVKLGKSKRFVQGVGLRKLHADGSFEWQRRVTKGKPLWVYFTVTPVKSNTVALMAKTART